MLLLLLAAPAAASVPPLAIFAGGFPTGEYAMHTSRSQGRSERICIQDASQLMFANQTPGHSCRLTVVKDEADRAIVTWTCPNGDSGRSEIRRDLGGLYVVHVQGIAKRLPYNSSAMQYALQGPCR